MKKFANVLLLIVFLFPYLTPIQVKGKTLQDLKDELEQQQIELNENQIQKELTEQQIININSKIKNVEAQINQTYSDIETLNNEIVTLNNQIEQKNKEIKELLRYMQVSSGQSAYLEYIFGATSFTDFIYRVAVSEQLSEYNNKLIDEFNKMIEANETKQKEIENKRVELGAQQVELATQKSQLGTDLESLTSTSIDIEDEIEYQKEIIQLYVDKGCSDNENIATCGRKTLPAGTAFFRPLQSGYITSEWGYRNFAGNSWHEGIDQGSKSTADPIYAVASGMVATIFVRNSCGGNMVVVHHNVNGKNYTSVYAHLKTITVTSGQTVNKNTQIGTMGGGSDTQSYDKCTYGQHLHLTIATGLYGIDYSRWSDMNYIYSINPRSVINYPSGTYNPWDDRLTAY
ncbi:MAG: murein hydrolase activator EnvC family protein [Bacilli bacterium]